MDTSKLNPKCRICREPITTGRSKNYCEKVHYRNCLQCNKEFEVKKKINPPKLCSNTCASSYRNSQAGEKSCVICGSTFQATNNHAKFCGKDHFKQCSNCNKKFKLTTRNWKKDDCNSCTNKANKPAKEVVSKEVVKTTVKVMATCPRCHESVESFGTKVKSHETTVKCTVCSKSINCKCVNPLPKTCSKICAAATVDYNKRNEKSLHTLKVKYGDGIVNASQIDSVKKAKMKTMQDRYGVDNPSRVNEFKEKRKNTNLSRYGVENPAQRDEVKLKIEKTNVERYGTKNVFQAEEIKSKIKATNLLRYGVENIFQTEKSRQAMIKAGSRRVSKVNLNWKKTIENISNVNIELEAKFSTSSKFYADLKVNDLLIDFNPSFTHSSSHSYVHLTKRCKLEHCSNAKHAPITLDYHQLRFLEAEAEGKTLLQHFDWYDAEIFESVVRSKLHRDENRVAAKRCEIREISQRDANRFFKENHLLGATKGQTFCVGLFYEGELVHAHSYGPARLNKKYQWEAIRSCSKMNWQVQGAFSRADKLFFKTVDPDSVISYVDLALGRGETESNNPGWKLISTNRPSATWVFMGSDAERGSKPPFVKDASARKVSADRLLGFEVGEKYPTLKSDGSKFTNEDVLMAEGYTRIHDVGTRTFGWRRGS